MPTPVRPTRIVVSGGPKAQPYLSQLPAVEEPRFIDMAHKAPSRRRQAVEVVLALLSIWLLIIVFITFDGAVR